MSPFMRRIVPGLIVWITTAGCGGGDDSGIDRSRRPVTVIRLRRESPRESLRPKGSVVSWKTANVGFEVPGQVIQVLDENTRVEGGLFKTDGRFTATGDIVARLDDAMYRLKLDAVRARVRSAEAEKNALRIEIERVLDERLAAARARLDKAGAEYERIEGLRDDGVVSERQLEQARSSREVARSEVGRLEAQKAATRAELKSTEARIARLTETVRQARLDLERTTLRTPFPGIVSKVHVISGAFVKAGAPVVTVMLMDPIEIELPVSPETDRALREGEFVDVYPPGRDEPVRARIYRKDAAADPATRTFTLHLIARNRRLEASPENNNGLPRVEQIWPVHRLTIQEAEKAVILEGAIRRDDEGAFVWKVRPLENGGERGDPDHPSHGLPRRFRLVKARIEPGDTAYPLIGAYVFREAALGDDLGYWDLYAGDVPQGVEEGDIAVRGRRQWLFRPGDLARVSLRRERLPEGLYAPVTAILVDDGSHYIYLVEENGEGPPAAHKIRVRVGPAIGDRCRIEAMDQSDVERLSDGVRIVLKGAAFVEDGQPLRILDPVEED